MRRSKLTRGQSIVEMAFVLPILLLILFGIIEFGWLIFAYSTISQAARNGAEVAAQLPPYQSWLDTKGMSAAGLAANFGTSYPGYSADRCVNAILHAVEDDVTIFGGDNDSAKIEDYVTISYPNGGDTRNLKTRGPIQIEIKYPVKGLTPLWSLMGLKDGITMRVTQRRSIENMGIDPTSPVNVACASDLASYQEINPPH